MKEFVQGCTALSISAVNHYCIPILKGEGAGEIRGPGDLSTYATK